MRSIGPDIDRFNIVTAPPRGVPRVLPRLSIMADGRTTHSSEVAPLVARESRDQGRRDKAILEFVGYARA